VVPNHRRYRLRTGRPDVDRRGSKMLLRQQTGTTCRGEDAARWYVGAADQGAAAFGADADVGALCMPIGRKALLVGSTLDHRYCRHIMSGAARGWTYRKMGSKDCVYSRNSAERRRLLAGWLGSRGASVRCRSQSVSVRRFSRCVQRRRACCVAEIGWRCPEASSVPAEDGVGSGNAPVRVSDYFTHHRDLDRRRKLGR
jgi:hypothetical protein